VLKQRRKSKEANYENELGKQRRETILVVRGEPPRSGLGGTFPAELHTANVEESLRQMGGGTLRRRTTGE
jgi:hypothetical protein